LEGMRLVMHNLLTAYRTPDDMSARAQMMSAAAMGAVAFQKGLGAIHALSHPIGAVHHTHHGTTNAVVMQPVLRFNREAVEARLSRAADYLGISGGFDGLYDAIGALNASLSIPSTLTELGVVDPDLDRLTTMALEDPSVGGNPVAMTPENTRALFEACL
ncbi:MAG: iron-containing alcohol dehydrogenase, partial [Pseudomonadota bacterium]